VPEGSVVIGALSQARERDLRWAFERDREAPLREVEPVLHLREMESHRGVRSLPVLPILRKRHLHLATGLQSRRLHVHEESRRLPDLREASAAAAQRLEQAGVLRRRLEGHAPLRRVHLPRGDGTPRVVSVDPSLTLGVERPVGLLRDEDGHCAEADHEQENDDADRLHEPRVLDVSG